MNADRLSWPNGKRCAVCLTFDCDGDSLIHTSYPSTQHNYAGTTSWLQYDQVAIPKIVRLFDSYGIQQTFFVPAWILQRSPSTFECVIESGHEIAHHGFVHESPNAQTEAGERYWFRRSLEVLESFTGKRPVGYRAPWGNLSHITMDILVEEGLEYDTSLMNDDNPYILRTKLGDLIELPTDWSTIEDWSQYVNIATLGVSVRPSAPDVARRVFLAEFEAAYDSGGLFVATFHPMVSGRPARLRSIASMIDYIGEKGDAWFAPLEEIAQHVRSAADAGAVMRVVDWPFYPVGAIPEIVGAELPTELRIRTQAARGS